MNEWKTAAERANDLKQAWDELIMAVARELRLDMFVAWLARKPEGKR